MKNKASRGLVIILIFTLAITTIASITVLNKFGGFKILTGAWGENTTTTHGAVNLTISTNLVINFSDDSANFGSGFICSACTQTVIGTDGTNDTCNCGWSLPNGLMLENIGNRIAILKLYNTNFSSSLLYDSGGLSGYAWKFENFTDATCIGGNFTAGVAPWGLYTNITDVYSGNSNWTLCGRFNFTDGSDKLNMSFKFHITPTTMARSALSDTWTVSATDAGQ